MPDTNNSNNNLPGSSSSISLNESPTDEINYDSDISEDDHAIAEGDDDEYDDEEEDDDDDYPEAEEESFSVEVNTLTGNTFNIMIHPSDTVEVLKTRIAFQEGISPADQNILLENTSGCSNNATVQELNIDCNSKLTLVTNVTSGVPFKTVTFPDTLGGGGRHHLNGSGQSHTQGGGGGGGTDPISFKLAPNIKRSYNSNSNSHNSQLKNSSSSSSSSLRLPKISYSSNNTGHHNNHPIKATTTTYLDKNSNIIIDSSAGCGGAMHRNGLDGNGKSQQQQPPQSRLDEREWMKSLFNKVVQRSDGEEGEENGDGDYDDGHTVIGNGSPRKIVIDIDSTNGAANAAAGRGHQPPLQNGNGPRISTRYVGTKYGPEEDGSILVVQGDDGVILIIQKNTGQLLEETWSDSNNNDENGRSNGSSNKGNRFSGRMGRMGRYTMDKSSNGSVNGSGPCGSSYKKNRYQQQDSKAVNDKIKENAVTLEKMRQVRGMMAAQKREKFAGRNGGGEKVEMEEGNLGAAGKVLEFPKIGERVGNKGGLGMGKINGGGVGYKSKGMGGGGGTRKSAMGSRSTRSINSSKMSLNRLIAEIYLQSKRKGHSFQPGQPPYTDQQLLRYVHLKTAILLDEQKRSKMEPCSKCQLDDDWSYNETAPYLVPTVIMNRYKRLANGRNSKSLDKENNLDDDDLKYELSNRRKSMIPVVIPSNLNQNGYLNGNRVIGAGGGGGGGGAGGESYIPRLILTNRDREKMDNNESSNRHNQSSASMATTTTTSSLSRRSSSSMTKKGGAGGKDQGAYRFSTIHTNNGTSVPDEDDNDDNGGICDTIIITNGNTRTFIGNGRVNSGGRPSLKVYPKIYPTINGGIGRTQSSSSRPGSTSKASGAKKSSVRCHNCKKKIGIACRYQCRCGLTFCSVHRYPETHNCTFDYKTEGRNKLRENNPVIVAQKIQEI